MQITPLKTSTHFGRKKPSTLNANNTDDTGSRTQTAWNHSESGTMTVNLSRKNNGHTSVILPKSHNAKEFIFIES